ncbi:hypothetical protein FRC08_013106 [Ceratobasidium sp. 394]|nr:hypothetical protein FRC08_013106 [Ceratobasidium sp. 394]
MPSARANLFFYVGVYAGIVFAAAVMATVNSSVQYNASLRASRKHFDALLNAIVYSPIWYIDVTPAGRILNRMSRDMTIVDTSLSWSLRNCSHWLTTFFAGVLTVSIILPPFLLPAALIAWLYCLLALGYVRTARDLKLEPNSRSPIFSSFEELLEGMVTVRAFSAEQKFLDVLHRQIDDTTAMWYNFWMLNRWLRLHFDALASLSLFVTTIFAISSLLGDGLAAVTITTAMSHTPPRRRSLCPAPAAAPRRPTRRPTQPQRPPPQDSHEEERCARRARQSATLLLSATGRDRKRSAGKGETGKGGDSCGKKAGPGGRDERCHRCRLSRLPDARLSPYSCQTRVVRRADSDTEPACVDTTTTAAHPCTLGTTCFHPPSPTFCRPSPALRFGCWQSSAHRSRRPYPDVGRHHTMDRLEVPHFQL